MNTTTIPTATPDSERQRITLNLHDYPVEQIQGNAVEPIRLTITHNQMERSALPHTVTTVLTAYYKGTQQKNTFDLEPAELPGWARELVHEHTPTWWTK
ncbi:hypothetical protein [Kitasatospora sp. NPDC087315]|uniref:hypothetical protein n=1 Tax=Kitasatospora sp. NPDC087315 TaxID=3364069 RepID=UPI00380A78D3